jgi:hypothetical protein
MGGTSIGEIVETEIRGSTTSGPTCRRPRGARSSRPWSPPHLMEPIEATDSAEASMSRSRGTWSALRRLHKIPLSPRLKQIDKNLVQFQASSRHNPINNIACIEVAV